MSRHFAALLGARSSEDAGQTRVAPVAGVLKDFVRGPPQRIINVQGLVHVLASTMRESWIIVVVMTEVHSTVVNPVDSLRFATTEAALSSVA